eukprot:CAMPEP_0204588320 /NCGR_PEP_ID=MMETSP0661-20131031/48551_1 /ASSEMBLY_ACC=CAM_ASM_000606 /TAXON_ID=109239 /ORGANISM="Alexandrium margalefi, Strain AMGDE01CS-322" /LENGTH=368 /DNA_ID=CAMNT_0051598125 /DNA_START=29 /DNA_END=1133 /DNA_ORIENTATION=+
MRAGGLTSPGSRAEHRALNALVPRVLQRVRPRRPVEQLGKTISDRLGRGRSVIEEDEEEEEKEKEVEEAVNDTVNGRRLICRYSAASSAGQPNAFSNASAESAPGGGFVNHAAIHDHHGALHVPGLRAVSLHPLHHVAVLSDDLAEHHVLPVQVLALPEQDEELRVVGVRPAVRHGQEVAPRVQAREALVHEPGSEDRAASCPVAVGDVASLRHEAGDDAVELGALEMQVPALLPGAEAPEVLRGHGHDVREELDLQPPGRLHAAPRAPDLHVEVDRGVREALPLLQHPLVPQEALLLRVTLLRIGVLLALAPRLELLRETLPLGLLLLHLPEAFRAVPAAGGPLEADSPPPARGAALTGFLPKDAIA